MTGKRESGETDVERAASEFRGSIIRRTRLRAERWEELDAPRETAAHNFRHFTFLRKGAMGARLARHCLSRDKLAAWDTCHFGKTARGKGDDFADRVGS